MLCVWFCALQVFQNKEKKKKKLKQFLEPIDCKSSAAPYLEGLALLRFTSRGDSG